MKLKGQNGDEQNVTSQSQGTINTVLASIGALGALTMGGGLLGRATGNTSNNRGESDGDRPVTRYEMALMMENARKDTEISALKERISANDRMNEIVRRQDEINANQMVYNATANGIIAGLQAQVLQLQGLTKNVIPSTNVVDIKSAYAAAGTSTTQTGD